MSALKKYFLFWAAKRAPRSAQVILRHKTIYIFPSKQGFAFLAVILLIWLLGTNYQNNLILGMAFFLLSVMLVSTIHAFKNMLGLTFLPAPARTATLGGLASFDINLHSRFYTSHHSITASLADTLPVIANVSPGQTAQLHLEVLATHRGWFKLPRVNVKSYFPLGLIRAWAYVDLEHRALIFPRSIATEQPPLAAGQGADGLTQAQQAGDEFHGFQTYVPGSPMSQVAWKQYARGAGLFLKDYRAQQSENYWLDWQYITARDIETGLSQMCYWVNQFADNNCAFGVVLPNLIIPMGTGDSHRIEALTALALFGWSD